MKYRSFVVLFSVPLLCVGLIYAAQRKDLTPTHDLMRQKLDHAQRVLEGIALSDFDMIASNAAKLGALSSEGAWRAYDTPEYVEQSAIFRRHVERLRKAAHEHDLDAATLAYTKMTFSCVECHKYIRDRRLTLAPEASKREGNP
ncbi:MAG: hypothetical protein ACTHMT_13610 [Verrucomicrobiota bacterium]